MERVQIISILVITMEDILAQSRAIHSGFTLKFNPMLMKEDLEPPQAQALFVKIPQESMEDNTQGQEYISKVYVPNTGDLGIGCTNQIARILFPPKLSDMNTITEKFENFINIPVIPQPFPDYKIIVATAPWNVKISGEGSKPAVIYIVFPEDDDGSNNVNIPAIYFVKKNSDLLDINKKNKVDPILVIDSNRTVTGLKSKEVAKFIKFKNKLINTEMRYKYEMSRK